MVTTLSDALGVNLGGRFGGSANEKDKGQTVEINAKLGRLSDIDRIQLINKLHAELTTDTILGVTLTEQQKENFKQGNPILLKGLAIKDGGENWDAVCCQCRCA